ncbi:MAG: HPr family phosphocarrier protein [Tissierellia bacterium]|nr:HPr family phosphocarrier protein [Tissierellia bacterium]
MKEARLNLKNEDGLHARAAALFVRRANQYASDITVIVEDNEINGKSIIGLMSLGIYSGQEVTLQADGNDEEEALKDLKKLVEEEL